MAKNENPRIEQQMTFIGGQTNDEYSGPDNSFWFSKNVDIRKNTMEATLSGAINNQVYAVGGVPRAIYGTQSTTQLAFCYNGYMSSFANATLRAHSSANVGSKEYCNVVKYGTISSKDALFVLSEKYIHTVAYNPSSLPGTVAEEQWTFANQDSNKPYLIFNGDLLIGDGNYIQKIQWTGAAYVPAATTTFDSDSAVIGIDETESILAIFELGDQVVFFTNKAQYFWDGFNSSYDRRVPRDATIVAAAQFKTVFTVITKDGTYMTLWQTSTGYDRVEIQKEEIYGSTAKKRLDQIYSYTNAMAYKDGICYMAGGADGELNSFGYYNPGMNSVLEHHITGTGGITCVHNGASNGLVYYGRYTGTTYYVGYLDQRGNATDSYTTKDGLIEMTPDMGGGMGTDKVMEKIRVGYRLENAGCFIPIYAKVNDETDVFTFYASSYTTLPTTGATYTHNSSTYTVVETKTSVDGKVWIYTQRTTGTANPTTAGTLTKSAGTGDASITFVYYVPYRIIGLIDGSNSSHLALRKYTIPYGVAFNKIQFAHGLQTDNASYTPRFGDFIWIYNHINNDL